MKKYSTDFYHTAIKSYYPTATNIRLPVVSGSIADVFLADVAPGKTFVYKFNDTPIIRRNHELCEQLNLRNIPIPRTTTHAYMQTSFEVYPYCPDKTLCEHMDAGITNNQIFDVYCDVIRAQKQISEIKLNEVSLDNMTHFRKILMKNIQRASRSPITRTNAILQANMSRTGTQLLLHNDINPKNILANDEYRFSKLIDMDAIAFCNEDYSVMRMLQFYPLGNTDELLDFYEDTMQRTLHRTLIYKALNTLNALRSYKRQFVRIINNNLYKQV